MHPVRKAPNCMPNAVTSAGGGCGQQHLRLAEKGCSGGGPGVGGAAQRPCTSGVVSDTHVNGAGQRGQQRQQAAALSAARFKGVGQRGQKRQQAAALGAHTLKGTCKELFCPRCVQNRRPASMCGHHSRICKLLVAAAPSRQCCSALSSERSVATWRLSTCSR